MRVPPRHLRPGDATYPRPRSHARARDGGAKADGGAKDSAGKKETDAGTRQDGGHLHRHTSLFFSRSNEEAISSMERFAQGVAAGEYKTLRNFDGKPASLAAEEEKAKRGGRK